MWFSDASGSTPAAIAVLLFFFTSILSLQRPLAAAYRRPDSGVENDDRTGGDDGEASMQQAEQSDRASADCFFLRLQHSKLKDTSSAVRACSGAPRRSWPFHGFYRCSTTYASLARHVHPRHPRGDSFYYISIPVQYCVYLLVLRKMKLAHPYGR
jgi:hypothetical protein